MQSRVIPFVIAAVFASAVPAQSPSEQSLDRVFYFTHTKTPQDVQEVATAIRSMTDIRQISTDATQGALALRATSGQMTLAEWLFHELDQPAGRQSPGVHEYRAPGAGDDVVRVFYMSHTETARELQELATLVRTIGDIRRVLVYNATRAIALRGTSDQVALAEWLINELDQPAGQQTPGVHEYRYSTASDGHDLVRVLYLTHVATPYQVQEIATLVRTSTGIRRLFTYNALRALTLRGTSGQVASAERLVKEQDK